LARTPAQEFSLVFLLAMGVWFLWTALAGEP
jgi:hypothetical protein